jgi:nucleoside-diphosphate-sugar epimerase
MEVLMRNTILITGATGYLGSALCVDLCHDHNIIGLSLMLPSKRLVSAAPSVQWEKGDVVEPGCLSCIFKTSASQGNPIDYIIHFAAYTDYGEKWHDEYSDTNVIGTRHMIDVAYEKGVRRLLFAGSIAALEPLHSGNVLTENSSAYGNIAYSKSKAMGEQLLFNNSDRVPVVILRLGGVFTDWCELPPLFSVMNLWSKPVVGRILPGRGNSGFPYIHRKDVVKIVRRIIDMDNRLDRFEILFASPSGCTLHKDLFPVIRRECGPGFSTIPVNISPFFAKIILHAKYVTNTLIRKKTYERAWMIKYVDRPLRVDTTYTKNKLDLSPTKGLDILTQLPILMRNFRRHHQTWLKRNINRNDQKYDYYPD